ncbi:hypothetical protein EUTSA_v10005171mg [Eutrema salsugineum]|uniref:Uncharacterized protein n=1 Tax=Eutrema salsugineum TaxID=72664 RepID=V4MN16_EUTSA|nr:root meristem growth factor 3 [Eutrema salsugineum]ESQ32946.1 hypothetical protein EUTSA_v10005171mg [Eutrema salsugineum]
MATLSKIQCLLIICFLCFFFRYSLHDGNQESGRDFASTSKVIEHGDMIIRGRKLMMTSGEGEETTMKSGKRETERKSSKGVDEDGLVAYTADYWRAKHHPPKNN